MKASSTAALLRFPGPLPRLKQIVCNRHIEHPPPTLAMIVRGARSNDRTRSPNLSADSDCALPSCLPSRKALDLSHQPSFRTLCTERSLVAVSNSGDPLLTSFFDGSAKWLYLSRSASRGHKIEVSGETAVLLDKFIHSLRLAGIIKKVHRNGFPFSYPFFRAKPCGQPRLLVDFSHLKGSVRLPKFCLPSFLAHLRLHPRDLLGWWAVRLDLKDAFYSVALPQRLQPIASFRVRKETYQFLALPMGLPFSPFLLQRVVNFLLDKLRAVSSQLFAWAHVDDIILAAPTHELCAAGTCMLIRLLDEAGFYVAWRKSQVFPTRHLNYCGLSLKFSGGTIRPTGRIQGFGQEDAATYLRKHR